MQDLFSMFSHIVYFGLILVGKGFIRGHINGGAYNRKQEKKTKQAFAVVIKIRFAMVFN